MASIPGKIYSTLKHPIPPPLLERINAHIDGVANLTLKVATESLAAGSKALKVATAREVQHAKGSIFNYAIVKFSPAVPLTVSATTSAQSTAASASSSCEDVVYYQIACLAALVIMFLMQAGITWKRDQLKKDTKITKKKLEYVTALHRTNKFLQKSEILARQCLECDGKQLEVIFTEFQNSLPKLIKKGAVPDHLRMCLHEARHCALQNPEELANLIETYVLPLINFYTTDVQQKMVSMGYVLPDLPSVSSMLVSNNMILRVDGEESDSE